ncbi:hypothetical protein DFS34DRAFT_643834 [Phlyctochytrium arcticum]|nr:hypothetical protein DFS34DRAFT_643834 [Phlyctochytrium arcticum]
MSDSEDDVPLRARCTDSSRTTSPARKARKPAIRDLSDSESDVPLSRRKDSSGKNGKQAEPDSTKTPTTTGKSPKGKQAASDDDSDVPLSKKVKAKASPRAKKEPAKTVVKASSTTNTPVDAKASKAANGKGKESTGPVKRKRTEASTAREAEAALKKQRKDEKEAAKQAAADAEEDEYKWWLEENKDDSIKWKTLEHMGPIFADPYVPHGVKMRYNGKEIELEPEAEEVATFFAGVLGTPNGDNPTFQKNFFADFQDILKKSKKTTPIKEFDKCDFAPIAEYLAQLREERKAISKEEKLKLKQEKAEIDAKYGWAILDGRKEKVGNYRIEPPGLFRGRGEHPKTGMLKKRVVPEQITLNIGEEAKIPDPPAGHQWGQIIHDKSVTWLATWKENVNGATKYIFLAATSSLKGQSDLKKFEKARTLKGQIHKIRRDYTAELRDKQMATRQRATAIYLIDRLALRAGNEKGDDEADTVGCCSLRFEHISLEPPNKVIFDFLGKDSIRYYNEVQVDQQVFKNLKMFKKSPKAEGDPLFDRINTGILNKYLCTYMPGLTAKVFRTYNASYTFQEELKKTPKDGTTAEKILAYQRANRQVAILCNHQRAVSANHSGLMTRIQDKLKALKYERKLVKEKILELDPKLKKTRPELREPESDLDDEFIERHKIALQEQEEEKKRKKLEKENEKRAAANGDTPEPSGGSTKVEVEESPKDKGKKRKAAEESSPKNKKVKAEELEEKEEKKTRQPTYSLPTLEKKYKSLTERIRTQKMTIIDKDENKTTALGTSKLNYIDPRISAAWCREYDVPLDKIFAQTLRNKFKWAMDVDENWVRLNLIALSIISAERCTENFD